MLIEFLKSRLTLEIWFPLALFFFCGTAAAQTAFEITPDVDRLIRSGLYDMYMCDFNSADQKFDDLIHRFPEHPIGYMYKAEVVWWKALRAKNNRSLSDAFERYTERAIEKGQTLVKKNPSDFYGTLYLASAYGNLTRFRVTVTKSYWGAMRAGMKGNEYNKAACALKEGYVDCLIGMGAYNYFTGSLPAVIKPFAWMLGARGDKDEGLKQLELAAQKGEYGQAEAKIVLLGVYYNEKRFEAYKNSLISLVDEYPANHVFYMWLADFYISQKNPEEGIRFFTELIKRGSESSRTKISMEHAQSERGRLEKMKAAG